MPDIPNLIAVNDWNKYHAWPPVGGLRHLIFHAETNGFKSAFKRVGRRVLIDEEEFFRCVEAANTPTGTGKTSGGVIFNQAPLGGGGTQPSS